MKPLVLKLSLMFIAVILTMTGLWFSPGGYVQDRIGLLNKMNALKTGKPPRLVLVGGSNLLTIKSSVLERELGIPILNMGFMTYSIQNEDLYRNLFYFLNKGDNILFVPDYESDIFNFCSNRSVSHEMTIIPALISPGKHIRGELDNGNYEEIFTTYIELLQMKVKTYFVLINPAALT